MIEDRRDWISVERLFSLFLLSLAYAECFSSLAVCAGWRGIGSALAPCVVFNGVMRALLIKHVRCVNAIVFIRGLLVLFVRM